PGHYGLTKRMADRLFLASGLEATILRPSLVYGPGARGVFVKLAGLVRRLPVIPVIGPGTWHLRPVFLDDLIDLVVATLARPELAGRTYDVGGRDLVTYNEFLAGICGGPGPGRRRRSRSHWHRPRAPAAGPPRDRAGRPRRPRPEPGGPPGEPGAPRAALPEHRGAVRRHEPRGRLHLHPDPHAPRRREGVPRAARASLRREAARDVPRRRGSDP